jgi:hypothetical protein
VTATASSRAWFLSLSIFATKSWLRDSPPARTGACPFGLPWTVPSGWLGRGNPDRIRMLMACRRCGRSLWGRGQAGRSASRQAVGWWADFVANHIHLGRPRWGRRGVAAGVGRERLESACDALNPICPTVTDRSFAVGVRRRGGCCAGLCRAANLGSTLDCSSAIRAVPMGAVWEHGGVLYCAERCGTAPNCVVLRLRFRRSSRVCWSERVRRPSSHLDIGVYR